MATKKARKTEGKPSPADYLKLPYLQTVVPEDDGTFRAEVLEFPGCIATGETRAAAITALQDVAESWLEAMLDSGQPIPAPMEKNDYSGKLVVRMPRSLHRKAAMTAERDGVSLNQFIVNSLAEQIGAKGRPNVHYAQIARVELINQPTSQKWIERHNDAFAGVQFFTSQIETKDARR